MNKIAKDIQGLEKNKEYEKAYSLGKQGLKKDPNDSEIIESLKSVTAALRSQCMDMAYRKQDCTPEYSKLEDLLRNVNELTQQDMYGGQV
ncbi:hypothetical protein [Vibrio coralliilyticus]|uniref:hypothetical protein n=1 Tax=Vibrio coralliilyticus TaxID=190893 RepID=UPI0017EED219|nr:hypothetical protein [Vibrio coralliilyticus]NUW67192.1 hypothetical protein [Vibrio coralliilyticus]